MFRQNCRALALLLFAAASLPGQNTGSLYGTVTDSAGAVVPNARVVARSVERGNTRDALANGSGEWVLTSLAAGGYDVTVEVSGFKTFVQRNILLDAEQNVKVDAKLELGSTVETMTVSG